MLLDEIILPLLMFSLFVTYHTSGTLMITAWVLLVNPAILLARYFKTAWPNKTLLKTAVWFTVR